MPRASFQQLLSDQEQLTKISTLVLSVDGYRYGKDENVRTTPTPFHLSPSVSADWL